MTEGLLTPEQFRKRLAGWFAEVARDLPWRRSRDPYQIWVSEIMLQQTRVDQAMPYFERFVHAFPTVEALAEADLDEVLLNWEGLGYYSRARNLHRAARTVVRDHGGALPPTYHGLSSLPGIGDYTASAVGSLAFGLPQAALDGNVIRVLCRYDGFSGDVTRAPSRRLLRERAQQLLDTSHPGRHNEAMMELGATVCTPASPDCAACPVRVGCVAFAEKRQEAYPLKSPRKAVPEYRIAVGVVTDVSGRILIQRRPEDGMLGGLWEFPGGKCRAGEEPRDACQREVREELGLEVAVNQELALIRHAYSHFRIRMHAFACDWVSGSPVSESGEPFLWIEPDSLDQFAFPRANRRLIETVRRLRGRGPKAVE